MNISILLLVLCSHLQACEAVEANELNEQIVRVQEHLRAISAVEYTPDTVAEAKTKVTRLHDELYTLVKILMQSRTGIAELEKLMNSIVTSSAAQERVTRIDRNSFVTRGEPAIRLSSKMTSRGQLAALILQVETAGYVLYRTQILDLFIYDSTNDKLHDYDLANTVMRDDCVDQIMIWDLLWTEEMDSNRPNIVLSCGPEGQAAFFVLMNLAWNVDDEVYEVDWSKFVEPGPDDSLGFDSERRTFVLFDKIGEIVNQWSVEIQAQTTE